MKTDISINHKTLDTNITFKVNDIKNENSLKDCLAIVSMISGDYALDPELDLEDMISFVEKAKSEDKMALLFTISEDGLELELLND
jgi:hypothetical protein